MRVAIIPGRGGSTRIPQKNSRLFFGRPIITYSIETAIKCGLFDVVYVSTDSHEIATIAYQAGANIIRREAQHALNEVGTQEVTAVTLEALNRNGIFPEYACCIYATAPMMTPQDLCDGWRLLMQVNPSPHFAYSTDQMGNDAGQWYWGKAKSFLDRVPLSPLSQQVKRNPIPNDRVCDINTPEDWAKAESMFASLVAIEP